MAKRKIFSANSYHQTGEADVLLGQGKNVKEACRALKSVKPDCTIAGAKEYGGLTNNPGKKTEGAREENAGLSDVADLSLDMRS